MIGPLRCIFVFLVAAALSSCAFLKAVTLPEARGVPGGELELTLFMFAPTTSRPPPAQPVEVAELPAHVRDVCSSPPVIQPPEPEPEVGPILGVVAVTAFTLAFGELTSALSGYVNAKAQRFTPPPYAARANVPAFRFLPGNGQAALRCVRLVRKIEEGGKSIKASDIIVSFERPRYRDDFAETGMVGILRHFELQRFAASTRATANTEDQVVKATVGIAFSLLAQTEGSDVRSVLTFDQVFVVPAAKLGQILVDNFEGRTAMLSGSQTAMMPEPSGQPATIAISVAETGDGVQEFQTFNEAQFNATAKVLGDALGNILRLKILPNQP
jgi:hypothetical protein